MNRKIIDFAGAWSGFVGGFGASGFRLAAARACSCAIIDANASEPMPQKAVRSETPGGSGYIE